MDLTAIKHEAYKNSTELSKYVWDLKCKSEDFTIDWSISDRARAYDNRTKRCNLCLAEVADHRRGQVEKPEQKKRDCLEVQAHEQVLTGKLHACNLTSHL